ncbi:MAG TPA: trypsin-like peptidase domain-containing protein [Allosphingosinicella sp.]|nr:trypsin-like peptidase domain-containing protein [Allosphingosinicella sp.]
MDMVRAPPTLVRTIYRLTGRAPLPDQLPPPERALYRRLLDIMADGSILGVAISEKEMASVGTGQLGIVFYVREKARSKDIDPEKLVPPVIVGPQGRAIFTDVRQVGDLRAHMNIAVSPVRSGFSVGHPGGRAGTLGAIVRRGGQSFGLSAMHVLANEGTAAVGDPVYYPSPRDRSVSQATRLGPLQPFTPFRTDPNYPNDVDAALVLIDPARLGAIDPLIPGARTPLRVQAPAAGMSVMISGRTSGDQVLGTIKGIRAHVAIDYPGLNYIHFRDQMECDGYARAGDSGALVLNAANGRVVGLHIAGTAEAAFFTPIQQIMAALNFTF